MYGCTSINCGVFLKTIDTPKIDNVLKIYFDVSLFRYFVFYQNTQWFRSCFCQRWINN